MEEKISGGRTGWNYPTARGEALPGYTYNLFENQLILDTDMGLLTIKGKGLHVSRLTLEKGEVDLEGTIDSLAYSAGDGGRKAGESLLGRLFR